METENKYNEDETVNIRCINRNVLEYIALELLKTLSEDELSIFIETTLEKNRRSKEQGY